MSDHHSAAAGDDSDRPLLSDARDRDEPASSHRQDSPPRDAGATESTPLLPREDGDVDPDTEEPQPTSLWARLRRRAKAASSTTQWATVVALLLLCMAVITILCIGFALPEAMEEYATQAAVFKPTKLSIDSFTANGINAHVKGDFYLDASRVEKKAVRDLGRAGTWIVRAVETEETTVTVSLLGYDIELGTVDIPPITVSVVEGEKTPIDVVAKVTPGKVDGLRKLAQEWIDGNLDELQVHGEASVKIKSGIFSFGTQKLVETLTFMDDQVPELPEYDISRLNIHEIDMPDVGKVISADVSISAFNKYPVSLSVPPMAFDILIPGCESDQGYLMLANATTGEIDVRSEQTVTVGARGVIRQLPPPIVSACPGSDLSPLDSLLGDYISGEVTTMYVRGSESPSLGTPQWITDIMKSITVAVPLTGHSMTKLIRNFSMEDAHFALPNPLADPNSPEAQPRISAQIKVLANVPEEMNFPLDVSRVRSIADVMYKGERFGILQIKKWQNATSKRIDPDGDIPALLAVEADIDNAPLMITDQEIFTDVIQDLLFGGGLTLNISASVDVEISSALGTFAVREIPAEGTVPLKPLLDDGMPGSLSPTISNLSIIETQRKILSLQAIANLTNPTNYSASVPYINIHVLSNGTILGNATATNLEVTPGVNDALPVRIVWDPEALGGANGSQVARDLLSSYISGRNTTITLRTHAGSIPTMPGIGEALSKFEIDLPTPRLRTPPNPDKPDEDPDDRPHFIDEATMHLVSSTADFLLRSPLRDNTIVLTNINATAIYNHTDPVGQIYYDLPIAIPPGPTKSPRLPVDWSLGSVGYDAVREALGGTLKLGAKAVVSLQIDKWEQTIDFEGDGIGAQVQL